MSETMNTYIVEVAFLTYKYHSRGILIVAAADLDAAKAAVARTRIEPDRWSAQPLEDEPLTRPYVSDAEWAAARILAADEVVIAANSGCC